MKKVFCITIALCLVFASVLPVYADPWTSTQAASVTSNVQALITAFTSSGGTMYNSISELMSWLTPVGSFSSSHSITGVTLYEIVDYIAWTLSGVGPTVYDTFQSMGSMLAYMPSLDSKFTTNNNHLSALETSLTRLPAQTSYTIAEIQKNAHQYLNWKTPGNANPGLLNVLNIDTNGNLTNRQFYWQAGSPLGNIALYLENLNQNHARGWSITDNKFFPHYNDQLTNWDSQGSTLTQVAFTPDSAIQGLYRYLAFTQRDVARLAYVFANDEELEARELAQANQEQVLDDFIDPNGSGSVSTTDLGSMSDASSDFKSNFSTNVGSSHIWDVFDNSRYNWFTQQTKNQLDTTPQTRQLKAVQNDYPTPLLDNYYDEISRIIGVDLND